MEKILETQYDARYCPRCGGKTKVYVSSAIGEKFTRYRRCKGCFFTFKTIEIPVQFDRVREV